MANEADSRHTTPTLRWGETAAEVPDANVVEPSGGKKDTGWNPGVDGLVGEWLNWVSWAAGVFNRYLERMFSKMLPRNCVSTSADETLDGIITAGSGGGLAVDVSACDVFLDGALFAVPAVVDLALAAADPTNPREDLVVARLSGLTPVYAVITGTPASSPSAPSPLSTDVQIGSVRVNALATTPASFTDRRERGAINLDRVIARTRVDAGDSSTLGDVVFRALGGVAPLVHLGGYDTASAQITCSPAVNSIKVEPTHLQFKAAITNRYDISALDFNLFDAGASSVFEVQWLDLGGSFMRLAQIGGTNADPAHAAAIVRVPDGATITAFRCHFNRLATNEVLRIGLYEIDRTTAVDTLIDEVETPSGSGSTGAQYMEVTGLSEIVDQATKLYVIRAKFSGAGIAAILIHNVQVDYELEEPWQNV